MLGFAFAGDMYDKESDTDVCNVCGSVVVCQVESGLGKPVLHKLNFIHPLIV